jgi:hypothetical protein
MEQKELEAVAEAAADAAQDFIDTLEEQQVLDTDALWDFVYQAALAAKVTP